MPDDTPATPPVPEVPPATVDGTKEPAAVPAPIPESVEPKDVEPIDISKTPPSFGVVKLLLIIMGVVVVAAAVAVAMMLKNNATL